MESDSYEFVYVNTLVYLICFLPVLVFIIPYFLLSGSGAALYCIPSIIAFLTYRLLLDRLLFPLYTWKGTCLLRNDGLTLTLRYTTIHLEYGSIRGMHYRPARFSTYLTIITRWKAYGIERSGNEQTYTGATPLHDLYRLMVCGYESFQDRPAD